MQSLICNTPLEILTAAHLVDRIALEALLDEVNLANKPGLVCPESNGSHTDMNYDLFLSSIRALKDYFRDQFLYGYHMVDFESIKQRGIVAEQNMLFETKGINTHKGAIFNLGFACVAIGRCFYEKITISAHEISHMLQREWQYDLLHHLQRHHTHHGQLMRQKYGISGAIEEVASGFITVINQALPYFKQSYATTDDIQLATTQTLFKLIQHVQDTNIVWRGGLSSLLIVQNLAAEFLEKGGVAQLDWQQQVQDICDYFVQHRLSPGGSADLLGVTLFLYKVEHEFCNSI